MVSYTSKCDTNIHTPTQRASSKAEMSDGDEDDDTQDGQEERKADNNPNDVDDDDDVEVNVPAYSATCNFGVAH